MPRRPIADGIDGSRDGEDEFSLTANSGTVADHSVLCESDGDLQIVASIYPDDASVVLLNATGVQVTPTAQSSSVYEGLLSLSRTYSISAGSYTVRVIPSASVASTSANGVVRFPGSIYARSGMDQEGYDLGQTPLLTAGLFDSVAVAMPISQTGASMLIAVHFPDGAITTTAVPVGDDGLGADLEASDGLINAAINGATLPGHYGIDVHVNATLVSGEIITRSAHTGFMVRSGIMVQGSAGLSVEDSDNNGKAESIDVDYDVVCPTPGAYRLSGVLVRQGAVIDRVDTGFTVGLQSNLRVRLVVPARLFVLTGGMGPYSLDDVRVVDPGLGLHSDAAAPQRIPALAIGQLEPVPLPVVSEVVPDRGPKRGGNEIIIRGQGLTGVQSVLIDGESSAFAVDCDNAVRVTIPQHSRTWAMLRGATEEEPHTADVTVIAPWGQATLPGGYTFERRGG